jgi:hypothetical protein
MLIVTNRTLRFLESLIDFIVRTKLIMLGMEPQHAKGASGVGTDTLRRKVVHLTSEERLMSK